MYFVFQMFIFAAFCSAYISISALSYYILYAAFVDLKDLNG